MYNIEQKWEYNLRHLRSQGINNPIIWARRGGNESLNIDSSNYGISETMSELHLIHMLRY